VRIWPLVIVPITRYFRARRGKMILQLFPDIGSYRICDLGGSIHFWHSVGLPVAPENIEILNLSKAAVDAAVEGLGAAAPPGITVNLYDGKHIPRPDKHYDLLICNSVIEHVQFEHRRPLVEEMLRVARRVFLQTPAWEFPVDPHFLMPLIHWLPKRVGFRLAGISPWRILSRPSRDTISEYFYETNLLSQRKLRELFPEATLIMEKSLGMTKSYCAVVK
jgi:Methyltransferase domain